MNEYQINELASSYPDVVNIISSLKKISQAIKHPESITSISSSDLSNLTTSIDALESIVESENLIFSEIVGRFISRADAKDLRGDFMDWSSNIFRSGVIKNMPPLYVTAGLVSKLLMRIKDDDFLEICLGKKNEKICVMLAAVTAKGERVDDPDKSVHNNEDVLDDMRPCLPPKTCPQGLEE